MTLWLPLNFETAVEEKMQTHPETLKRLAVGFEFWTANASPLLLSPEALENSQVVLSAERTMTISQREEEFAFASVLVTLPMTASGTKVTARVKKTSMQTMLKTVEYLALWRHFEHQKLRYVLETVLLKIKVPRMRHRRSTTAKSLQSLSIQYFV